MELTHKIIDQEISIMRLASVSDLLCNGFNECQIRLGFSEGGFIFIECKILDSERDETQYLLNADGSISHLSSALLARYYWSDFKLTKYYQRCNKEIEDLKTVWRQSLAEVKQELFISIRNNL